MEALDIQRLPKNIRDKLIVRGNHWIWDGATTGYTRKDPKGTVRFHGKMQHAHRVVFHLLAGFDLTSGLQANHKRECPYSLCCNPNCLYAGTQKENVRDSIALGHNKELNKTQCKTCGGKYSISPTTGHRYCQTCKNRRRDEWRLPRKGLK